MDALGTKMASAIRLSCIAGCFVLACSTVGEDGTGIRDEAPAPSASASSEPEVEPEPEAPPGEPMGVPPGCEDVLVWSRELPQCDAPGCEQIALHADKSFRFGLYLRQYYFDFDGKEFALSEAELERHRECVVGQLASLGVAATVLENGDVEVDASYGEIRSALHTTAVHSVWVLCSELGCLNCETLSEADCRADPGCWPIRATRFDAGRSCNDIRYAGCYRNDLGCGAALTTGRSADGGCWMFDSTCQPTGFVGTSSTDPGCGYAQFQGTARCTQP